MTPSNYGVGIGRLSDLILSGVGSDGGPANIPGVVVSGNLENTFLLYGLDLNNRTFHSSGLYINGFPVLTGESLFINNSGKFVLNTNTGQFASNLNLVSTGQYLNSGISQLNLWTGSSSGIYYPLHTNPYSYITTGQTGAFGGAVNTGVLTGAFYPLIGNPSYFITTGQTGAFGNAVNTGILTGVFYPLSQNPAGYLTGWNSGLYALNANTGNFITTGQTGAFGGGSANTGALTGIFYPLSNPSGFLTSISGNVNIPSNYFSTNINWTLGNTFYTTLSGNTNFSFNNQLDGQNIVVSVANTGTNGYSGIFSGIKWPRQNTPLQSSGNYTDIYTFVCITGLVYGTVIQGY